jgi:hypothetical protein
MKKIVLEEEYKMLIENLPQLREKYIDKKVEE